MFPLQVNKKMGIITGRTKIVGVFGYPIAHSLSPHMHNAVFKELNLDFIYLAFEVKPENLSSAIKSISALNMYGINLTIPHKEACLPYLDEITKEAKLIGAVNTIEVRHLGSRAVHLSSQSSGQVRLIGHNTDALGFIRSLKESKISIKGKKILLLGAGGAGKSISFALALNNANEIYIVNRTLEKAKILAENLKKKLNFKRVSVISFEHTSLKNIMKTTDIIINATSAGMKNQDSVPVPVDYLNKKTIVYDLIYNPATTKLLKLANEKGCRTFNGESMLVHQGAIAFEIWTKLKAPVNLMRKALRKALNV